ncbi:hypothetical protein [Paenibacillus flagellatus]|nr:hypothetical protein [Paenibacillus flagellatus]
MQDGALETSFGRAQAAMEAEPAGATLETIVLDIARREGIG